MKGMALEVTPDSVTVTVAVPAACAGETVVIVVGLVTVTEVAACPVPNVTVAPLENPVPVMVTMLPPVASPEVGLIEVIAGAVTLDSYVIDTMFFEARVA